MQRVYAQLYAGAACIQSLPSSEPTPLQRALAVTVGTDRACTATRQVPCLRETQVAIFAACRAVLLEGRRCRRRASERQLVALRIPARMEICIMLATDLVHGAYPHLLCVARVCLKEWEQSQHLAVGPGLSRRLNFLVAIWILFKAVANSKGHECTCKHAGNPSKG